ncbi:MAG: undecaprenyl-diphosphate phosphatase [Thermoguttaceae bacterium]|jgi:undecaprenyl-diphosphatase
MNPFQVIILAIVQGLAELLPVSSSAHVIVAEKLMGLDPAKPEMTLLLVMLHTGTMFAVILYFWRAWRGSIFASREAFWQQALRLLIATVPTVAVGVLIIGTEKGAERLGYQVKDASGHLQKIEVELLFRNLGLIAAALTAGGVLILVAGLVERRRAGQRAIGFADAAWIGVVQSLFLPFRGFSRSGGTISTGLLRGVLKPRLEEFSFAMAVIVTPPIIVREVLRLVRAQHESSGAAVTWSLFAPSLLGMVCAFLAGLLALKWLSRWLEGGRWYLFGAYCLLAAAILFTLHCRGY